MRAGETDRNLMRASVRHASDTPKVETRPTQHRFRSGQELALSRQASPWPGSRQGTGLVPPGFRNSLDSALPIFETFCDRMLEPENVLVFDRSKNNPSMLHAQERRKSETLPFQIGTVMSRPRVAPSMTLGGLKRSPPPENAPASFAQNTSTRVAPRPD